MHIFDQAFYDALIEAIGDCYSKRILAGTVSQARSVEDMSASENIPIATAYRRVRELEQAGLLIVEKIEITEDGKKYELHRCPFKSFQINLELDGGISIDAQFNEVPRRRLGTYPLLKA